ncbi:YbaY family lipoprotein [Deinococcus sp.]|uniref:YbaY family lipoprotein n=1 Tax=Deinococcus sp. TaxID=47478 RepID=UPI003B58FD82
MKTLSLLAALCPLAATPAQAQTVINGVTISKPPPAAPSVAPTPRVVPAFVDEDIPADWLDIRGRISAAAGRTTLPAGSRVTVKLLDASQVGQTPKTLVSTTFKSSSLPVSYQLVSSPRRFTTTGLYSVVVRITNASGELIYSSAQSRVNPAAKRILADVRVVNRQP